MTQQDREIRPEKRSIVDELRRSIAGSSYFFLFEYRGLTVGQLSDLRGRLRKHKANFHVFKNRYMKRVAAEAGVAGMEPFLKGPTGVVIGDGDITAAAKLLKAFSGETTSAAVKAGAMGKQFLTAADIKELADLPSKDVLRGKLVGTIAAPLAGLVGVMQQKVASLLYVLKAIEEKKKQ